MRAFATALGLAFGLLLLGLVAAPAHAGPGLTFYPKGKQGVPLAGSGIPAIADVPQRTYTLPPTGGEPTRKVTLKGLSVRAMLVRSGVSPDAITFVQVVNGYGGLFVLKRPDFSTALFTDDGTTTRFFRSGGAGGPVRDLVEATAADGPLEISVEGGSDIPVTATASTRRTTVGKTVRFKANVRFSPPGTQYSYEWEFGDGIPVTGDNVTHQFDTSGPQLAQVSVRNLDPDCATRCNGVEQVSVQVGDKVEQPDEPDPTPGGQSGGAQTPGSATGTGGGGQGGSGGSPGGTGNGQDVPSENTPKAEPTPAAAPKPPPPPRPVKPFGTTISGVLINDTGAPVRKLPTGKQAGTPAGVQATRGGESGKPLHLFMSGLLALGVVGVGALRERRGVRLRVA